MSLLVTLSFRLGIPALIPAANEKILLAIYKNPSLIKLKMPDIELAVFFVLFIDLVFVSALKNARKKRLGHI